MLELVNSERWKDSGRASDRPNTGYSRLILTPGVEVGAGNVKVFADLGLPVYMDMNGNQLVSQLFPKLTISYMF